MIKSERDLIDLRRDLQNVLQRRAAIARPCKVQRFDMETGKLIWEASLNMPLHQYLDLEPFAVVAVLPGPESLAFATLTQEINQLRKQESALARKVRQEIGNSGNQDGYVDPVQL